MSKLNFLVYLNTYSDANASNNPSLSNFKWTREVTGLTANNPVSHALMLNPGETRQLFSGSRTLLGDGTTQYSISLKPLSSNTYRITYLSGTAPQFKPPRSIGTNATTPITVTVNGPIVTYSSPASSSATPAQFVGTVAGMTTSVTIVALTAGSAGNVSLTGDGTSSLNQLIVAWNTAHPSNQLQLQAGDDSQVPDSAAVLTLSGGTDAIAGLNTSSIQIGDLARIGSEFNTLNQGEFEIISKTSTSFTVANDIGANEGPIVLGSDFANQIMVYGSTNVQKGDTLVISSGFSPATYGSYAVTDVTATYVEFYTTDALPIETGIISTDLAIYGDAKSLIYLETSDKITVTMNGSNTAKVEPNIINNQVYPGIFMLNSTMYSISITNNSLNVASLFVATVE